MLGRIIRSQFLASILAPLLYMNSAFALTWNTPPTEILNQNPADFEVVSDPSGNAFFTYMTDTTVNVVRFSALTGGFEPNVQLYTISSPTNMDIATDATSTALLVIDVPTDSPNPPQIVAIYFNGSAWTTPVPLATLPMFSNGFPSISMDGHGNGLAGWVDAGGTTPPGDITVSFFNGASQTWGPLQVLTPAGTGGFRPLTAYSSNGTAAVLWRDLTDNLYASNFDGVSWTPIPVTIASTATDYALGIDSAGNALAVWMDTGTLELLSSYYNGSSWGAPVSISGAPTIGGGGSDFAMSSSGLGIAVWLTPSNDAQYSVFTGGAWSAPASFATNVNSANVAVDTMGNAVLVWGTLDDETFSVSLPLGGPLGPTDSVDPTPGPSGNIFPGSVAFSDNGRAFLMGTTSGDEGTTLAGTYSLLPLPPTGSINGRVCKNKYANATERVKIITWTTSNPSTVSYNIRRNGKLIANVSSSGPLEYKDRNRCKKTDVYVVTSVSASGVESDPLTISIK